MDPSDQNTQNRNIGETKWGRLKNREKFFEIWSENQWSGYSTENPDKDKTQRSVAKCVKNVDNIDKLFGQLMCVGALTGKEREKKEHREEKREIHGSG